jgi:AbrB family looped-hinge helix DNA binding protein
METTATSKGQIVIPSSIRRKLAIEEGTRIKIEFDEQNSAIVLKPITRESIKKFRGILKLKPGMKLATQQLLDDRKEDLQKEEAKLGKHGIR